jgi:hypothetical protein
VYLLFFFNIFQMVNVFDQNRNCFLTCSHCLCAQSCWSSLSAVSIQAATNVIIYDLRYQNFYSTFNEVPLVDYT